MSGDEKVAVAITSFIVIGVMFVVMCITYYWTDHNTKIVELIRQGADPVEAMCAMQDDYGTHPTCIILATKKVSKE